MKYRFTLEMMLPLKKLFLLISAITAKCIDILPTLKDGDSYRQTLMSERTNVSGHIVESLNVVVGTGH